MGGQLGCGTCCRAGRIAGHGMRHARQDADRVVFGNVDPSSSEVFRCRPDGRGGGESADVVGDGPVGDCARGLFVGGGRAGGVAGALRGAPRHQVRVGPIGHLSGGPPLEEPPIPVAIGVVKKAVSRVRAGKAAGPSGVVVRMVGAAGSAGCSQVPAQTGTGLHCLPL